MFFEEPTFTFLNLDLLLVWITQWVQIKKATTIKLLRKWEKEFQLKLDFDINTGCSDCKKWEPRIKEIKCFSDKWIKGTENIGKDVVEKQIKGEP